MFCKNCQCADCVAAKPPTPEEWNNYIAAAFNEYPQMPLYYQLNNILMLAKVPVGNYRAWSESLTAHFKSPEFAASGYKIQRGNRPGLLRDKMCSCGIPRDICLSHRCAEVPREDSTVCREAAPVDNYTCACGNTKCNTSEKSCWKCGTPIST